MLGGWNTAMADLGRKMGWYKIRCFYVAVLPWEGQKTLEAGHVWKERIGLVYRHISSNWKWVFRVRVRRFAGFCWQCGTLQNVVWWNAPALCGKFWETKCSPQPSPPPPPLPLLHPGMMNPKWIVRNCPKRGKWKLPLNQQWFTTFIFWRTSILF